jgi:hypothetical protein
MDKALTPLMSSCEEAVIAKIRLRQKAGLTKYGVTMERTDLTHAQWLNHLQAELLDAAVYIEKLLSLPGHLGVDAPLVPKCANCGRPATCYGAYEDDHEAYACDACCGHGNEDGHCSPIDKAHSGQDEKTPTARDGNEDVRQAEAEEEY